MQVLLDNIGGFIISGTVVFLIMNLNILMNDTSQEIFKSAYNQSAALSSAQVIEKDIYLAGYRIPANKITMADSLNLKFNADVNNDSLPDIVYYYLGTTSTTAGKPLFRQLNTGTAIQVAIYSAFSFSFYDSLYNKLTASTTATQAGRDRIRSIELVTTAKWPVLAADSTYQSIVWRKTISPKNL